MRVLTLTNMYPSADEPFRGIFVAEQVASLRKRGIETDVLFVNGPRSRWNYLRGVAELRRTLRATSYDLIHAHYVFSGMIALTQAIYLPARRRLPIVLTHHGIEAQRGWTAPLCRWTGRRVTRTIATSRRVQEALRLPGVEIVPCGVDTVLFRPLPRDEARAALGLPTATPLILFAAMRRPEKRFDLVTAAVELLRTTRPAVQLVIAEAEPHERMPFFMNACDVLILASEGEGSPMVIKEAMACNLPIVSVDVGDVAEVIGQTAGGTSPIEGCFLAERTPEALAAGLAQALDFGGRTAGRERIMALSLDAIAGRLEEIYRDVIA